MEPTVEFERKEPIEVEKDPKEFLRKFYESEIFRRGCSGDDRSKINGLEQYADAVESRRKILIDTEPVSKDEIKEIFLGSDNAKALMIIFARDRLRLGYDEKFYSQLVKNNISEYQVFLRFINSDFGRSQILKYPTEMTQDKIRERDNERQFKHDRLAKALMEDGLVPNIRLGRVMGRLLMIDSGDDTFDMIQKDESGRYRRLAGVIESEQLSHG